MFVLTFLIYIRRCWQYSLIPVAHQLCVLNPRSEARHSTCPSNFSAVFIIFFVLGFYTLSLLRAVCSYQLHMFFPFLTTIPNFVNHLAIDSSLLIRYRLVIHTNGLRNPTSAASTRHSSAFPRVQRPYQSSVNFFFLFRLVTCFSHSNGAPVMLVKRELVDSLWRHLVWKKRDGRNWKRMPVPSNNMDTYEQNCAIVWTAYI